MRILRQALERNRKIKQTYPSACSFYSVRLALQGKVFFSVPIKTRNTKTSRASLKALLKRWSGSPRTKVLSKVRATGREKAISEKSELPNSAKDTGVSGHDTCRSEAEWQRDNDSS